MRCSRHERLVSARKSSLAVSKALVRTRLNAALKQRLSRAPAFDYAQAAEQSRGAFAFSGK
jgi:hypothetical protein